MAVTRVRSYPRRRIEASSVPEIPRQPVNWQIETPLPSRWHLEERRIDVLRPQQIPLSAEGLETAMRQGEPIPLISIARDGTVLDGNHRVYAAARVLGKDSLIPVVVSEVW